MSDREILSPEKSLTEAEAIALEYLEEREKAGLPLPPAESGAICAFAAWIMRNYDVYRLDEVNRG